MAKIKNAGERGGGVSMKGEGTFIISLRGVNHLEFWSHLGLHARKYINIYLIYFKYAFILWSEKAWVTPRLVSFRGVIQNFRRASPPRYMQSPPPPPPSSSPGLKCSEIFSGGGFKYTIKNENQ